MTLAARDAVVMVFDTLLYELLDDSEIQSLDSVEFILSTFYQAGGRYWPVPLGRRDGTTASEKAVNEQIPSPFEPLQNITAKFTSKGLDLKDVVVLSGSCSLPYLDFNLLSFDSKKK